MAHLDDEARARLDAVLAGEDPDAGHPAGFDPTRLTPDQRAELERTWGTSPEDGAQQARMMATVPEG